MASDSHSSSFHRPEQDSLLEDGQKIFTPVTLAQGYESRHSNSDLLGGLLNKTSNSKQVKPPPPDRWNLLFFIFMVHGIGTLMPWNMFITAKEYFTDYKLNLNLIQDTNSTDYQSLYEYNTGFLGYIIFAAQIPNLLCSLLNLFVQFGAESLGPRIAGSIILEIILFIGTIVLAMVDTSTWPVTFFFITIVSVVFLSAAGGVYQNSVFGLAAKLPQKYTGAIVLGTNISGTLTSLMSILSSFASPNQRTSATYYFISALFVLLLCLDTYCMLPRLKLYRHYQSVAREASDSTSFSGSERRPSLWSVFRLCWFNCLNVFLCFFCTLACFPAITSEIVAIDENFPVEKDYFIKVFCFLFFNATSMLGNTIPMFFKWPSSPKGTFWPIVLRFVFIPFFVLCNYRPGTPRVFRDRKSVV